MDREEACQLVREALDRIASPSANANGGDMQVGGAYWRLTKVLNNFLLPQLMLQEGQHHATHLLEAPTPTPVFRSPLNERVIRMSEVEALVGMKKSVIYRMISEGTFPAPIQLTPTARAWRFSDVQRWINHLPEVSPPHATKNRSPAGDT